MSVASVAGDWSELVRRLDRAGVPARWAATDAALHELDSVQQLDAWTRKGRAEQADAVIGALVRLAAADGGGDADASLVLVHLLWPGMVRTILALRRNFGRDAEAVVASALVEQIRSFPWQRRTRAHAANLLRDTRRAVIEEAKQRSTETPLDLADPDTHELFAPDVDDVVEDVLGVDVLGVDAKELLRWAMRSGVVSAGEVSLLLELVSPQRDRASLVGGRRADVAALLGVSERTVERQRDRALTALRDAVAHFAAAA